MQDFTDKARASFFYGREKFLPGKALKFGVIFLKFALKLENYRENLFKCKIFGKNFNLSARRGKKE